MAPFPKIDPQKLTILAGAGISVPSGLASGQMFNSNVIETLVPASFRDSAALKPLVDNTDNLGVRFEHFIQLLRDYVDPDLLILQYLEQSWVPSALHFQLAGVIERGSHVLTTNFDSLIELAHARKFPDRLRVVLKEEDYRRFCSDWSNSRMSEAFGKLFSTDTSGSLLKLHGSLRSQQYLLEKLNSGFPESVFSDLEKRTIDTIGATLDAVGRLTAAHATTRSTYLLPDHVTSALKIVLRGRDLLILGYSGSDDFDIKPTLKLLRSIYRRVIWIDHSSIPCPVVRTIRDFTLIRGRTSEILASLVSASAEKDSCPESAIPAPRKSLKEFFEIWSGSVGLTEQTRTLISGQLLEGAGRLSNAIALWEYGLETVSSRDPAMAARYYLNLGEAYLWEGSSHYSEEIFSLALQRSLSARSQEGIIRAKLGLGYSLIHLGHCWDLEDPMNTNSGTAISNGHKCLEEAIRATQGLKGEFERLHIKGLLLANHLEQRYFARSGRRPTPSNAKAMMDAYEWIIRLDSVQIDKFLFAEILKDFSLDSCTLGSSRFATFDRDFQQLCKLLHVPLLKAIYFLELADLKSHQDHSEALAYYKRSRISFNSAQRGLGQAAALQGEAVFLALAGNPAESLRRMSAAISLYNRHGAGSELTSALMLLGLANKVYGDNTAAKRCFDRCITSKRFRELQKSLGATADDQDSLIRKTLLGIHRSTTFSRQRLGESGWSTRRKEFDFEGLLPEPVSAE